MGLHADQQRHQSQHAKADDDRAVADGRGDEGRLDQVLAHGEEALCDGLIADRVGQHRHEEGRALLQDRLGREEVRLLRGHLGQALLQDIGAAEAEQNTQGMMMTATAIIATTCAKSVRIDARNPDHRV